MTLFLCLDDNNGMAFNKRRQSRDSVVTSDIVNECNGGTLYIAPYSKRLLDGKKPEIYIGDDFLEKADKEDFCFTETVPVSDKLGKADKIIIYRWNRDYPYDLTFDCDLPLCGFELSDTNEFAGSSHDCITKEIWVKTDREVNG